LSVKEPFTLPGTCARLRPVSGLHPTAERVQTRLRERGLDVAVLVLPSSTRTAEEAAAACGCELGQIERFGMVWCAAGTPNAVFEVAVGDLLRVVAPPR
jgi:prolyl-tRNA editing enzyme YbaK/EbsC (Cys-tRNA(Pro) deacylase)